MKVNVFGLLAICAVFNFGESITSNLLRNSLPANNASDERGIDSRELYN